MAPLGFSHSDIRGSRAICASPRLIAASHVLRRLPVPRHPPCALDIFFSKPLVYLKVDVNTKVQSELHRIRDREICESQLRYLSFRLRRIARRASDSRWMIEMMILQTLCNFQGARGGAPRAGPEPWEPDAANSLDARPAAGGSHLCFSP